MARKSFASGAGLLGWLGWAVLLLMADQFTKLLIMGYYQLGDSTAVTSFFNIVRVHNSGAAFSFLAGAGGWQRWFFIILAVVASAFITVWLRKLDPRQRREAMAWSLVLGGALGNLIDRILYGYVIDFLDVYYGDWHWPAFNVADSAITVGVVLLLLDSFKSNRPPESA